MATCGYLAVIMQDFIKPEAADDKCVGSPWRAQDLMLRRGVEGDALIVQAEKVICNWNGQVNSGQDIMSKDSLIR